MILSGGKVTPANIETVADRSPIFYDSSYYANTMIPMLGSWVEYGSIYRRQIWVNTIVRKLAFGTARLTFNVREEDDKGNTAVIDGAPLGRLLAAPNPRLDPFRLWLWTTATYDIYGEAFWLKIRDDRGRVRELYPAHPSNMIYRRDQETGEPFWIYSTGVRNVSALPPIPAADVVPFLSYNPEVIERGLSNLEPLRQTLLAEDASRRGIESWWKRGARPSLMISAPQALSDKAYDRLEAKVSKVHGGADQMGGTLVLEEGAKPIPVQLSAEEMQYIESRKLNREEVCAAYDVPPPVVHILDKATFSNITEQMRSMYRDTMAPRLGLFESVIDHHLVPDFYPADGSITGRFNLDDVVRGDFETRAIAVATLIEKGVLKPAEARPMFNLPDAGPMADKLYANSALQELGTPATRITVTDRTAVATDGEEQAATDANNEAAAKIDAERKPPVPPPAAPTKRTRNRQERRANERRGRMRQTEE